MRQSPTFTLKPKFKLPKFNLISHSSQLLSLLLLLLLLLFLLYDPLYIITASTTTESLDLSLEMAFAAATCLYHTIHHLLNSPHIISLDSSTQEILESAEMKVQSLLKTLRSSDRIKNSSLAAMSVDARIRDEAHSLQDAIDSEASAQFLDNNGNGTFTLTLHHSLQDINSFVEAVGAMKWRYERELYNPSSPYEAVAAAAASAHCDMVGLSDQFLKVRDHLIRDGYQNSCPISLAITGMAGIGKTTFTKKLLNDPSIQEKFECRAFVRVGQEFHYQETMRAIIAQLPVPVADGRDEKVVVDDAELDEYFERCLRGRKFIIVLDDVWDTDFECYVTRLLPQDCDGYVLPTSRIQETSRDQRYSTNCFQLRFMNQEESWELLRRKVFGELRECPYQLVKAGKKIAENCEGLPLLIITVAKLLSEAPMEPEYWDEVAEMRNSVFNDACDEIYEVLHSSYHYLDQNSKPCFLYMGVFPRNYVARRSRINNLWRAERFALFDNDSGPLLDNLVDSNLVVVHNLRSRGKGKAKACNLHIVYRYLSKKEGENNKFLYIINDTRAAGGAPIEEHVRDKRRLAIYHNALLAMKEVHHAIACVSTLRSLLCTGPYHQYQVPICFELKLLRVLDALSIRFYEFPVEVVKLIQLRYLSLTTNANLPPSIHKLCFLQFLIVHQHLSIKCASVVESSYLPVEIWKMQELEHLQVVGRNLPHPPPGSILPNLTKLLDFGVQTCVKTVLENIPKLEKLRIQIESGPDSDFDGAQIMIISDFDNLLCLEKLTSLGSVIKNPILFPKPAIPPRLLSTSIASVEKLSLSGFGYPWEDMSKIAELPRLKVLKLQCYAFRGENWEAKGYTFCKLHYLSIEDTDLVKWTGLDEGLPRLQSLSMKNCHKLQQISYLGSLRRAELLDCNPLVETWAERCCRGDFHVNYSWK